MSYTSPKNSRSRKSRIFNSRIIFVALAAFALLTLSTSSPIMAQTAGAIFTTNTGCVATDQNIYADKGDVYLNGGPNGGPAGLANGYYYVQVTTPSGTLLGTSVNSGFFATGGTNGQVVHVTGGVFDGCYKLSDILIRAISDSSGTAGNPGYSDTTNAGGVYKVWVSKDPTFAPQNSKTDNFKVNSTIQPTQTIIEGIKFYDYNGNGSLDPSVSQEVPIAGWRIELYKVNSDNSQTIADCTFTDGDGKYQFIVDTDSATSYIITEVAPAPGFVPTAGATWLNTTPTSAGPFSASVEKITVNPFGNVCLGAGGGLTLGFWSNKNGYAAMNDGNTTAPERSLLLGLCLVKGLAGTDYVPSASEYSGYDKGANQYKNDISAYLLNATATNMAYMLSAQLATMELNVEAGYVQGGSTVYSPVLGFITISDLMAAANTSLCNHNVTVNSGTDRTAQEALKNALDAANNNLNFVQSAPCSFISPYGVPCGQ